MYKHDEETQGFLEDTKQLIYQESANIENVLSELKMKEKDRSLPTFLSFNFFSVGSQMLTYQIWWNLESGNLLISLIGLRALVENLINVHFIYYHPDHENDTNWAEQVCNDFLQRSKDQKASKSKLGNSSLYKRAKEVGFGDFYLEVYSDLCNYSHFLANSIDVIDPLYYKGKTIESAIYILTCYHDILEAIASFIKCKFDNHIDEIKKHKQNGFDILKNIRKMQDEQKFRIGDKRGQEEK